MGIAISNLAHDESKNLRIEIRDYYIDEISEPEKYSQYLLKGVDDHDIFFRIKNELTVGRISNEMNSEFIEYLTKHPVPGSAELLVNHQIDTEK